MALATVKRSCPSKDCNLFGKRGRGNIRTHGWFKTKHSRRCRYRCAVCGKSFSSTTGSSYHKLKASRQQVDQACQMSAEGVNISTIAIVLGHAWNTINRWLERAHIFSARLFIIIFLLVEAGREQGKDFLRRPAIGKT